MKKEQDLINNNNVVINNDEDKLADNLLDSTAINNQDCIESTDYINEDTIEAENNSIEWLDEDLKEIIDTDNSMINYFEEWAKDNQVDSKAMNSLIKEFVCSQINCTQEDDLETEDKKLYTILGNKTDAIKDNINNWVQGFFANCNDNQHVNNCLEQLTSTADGVIFLNKIKETLQQHNVPSIRNKNINNPIDRNAIMKLQNSQAYTDQLHPDHNNTVETVRKAWQQLAK